MFAKAMLEPYHPILAHIIPIRRCNLACTYCNEFDAVSQPVPTAEMLRRVEKLAKLGTTIITISGGEPLLHPELERIIARIRSAGAIATLITNGYLLAPERIKKLNRSGLDYLQISIDNVRPDAISKKSLKVLDRKLRWLAEYAEFSVTINSVLGASIPCPDDAETIARRARELGFTSTVGLIHDHNGQSKPIDEYRRGIYESILKLGTPLFSFAQYDRFQKNIARGLPNRWHCRAGARYLYVCEDGLVHWCSQQRGTPGIPLEDYTVEDLKRQAGVVKSCADYCTVSCVHQTAMLDAFRETPRETLAHMMRSRREIDPSFKPPALVKALDWMFLRSGNKRLFEKLALRLLGVTRGER
ncbi:MAG: radical SAM protein [Bryobacteraceae bacterium]|nr:radical SAM protein [Bryobacteraceae bacterium]